MNILSLPILRDATEPIDRIIRAFVIFCDRLFTMSNTGFMKMLVDTIMSSPFLLVSVSLVLIGFVIGILQRLISI